MFLTYQVIWPKEPRYQTTPAYCPASQLAGDLRALSKLSFSYPSCYQYFSPHIILHSSDSCQANIEQVQAHLLLALQLSDTQPVHHTAQLIASRFYEQNSSSSHQLPSSLQNTCLPAYCLTPQCKAGWDQTPGSTLLPSWSTANSPIYSVFRIFSTST